MANVTFQVLFRWIVELLAKKYVEHHADDAKIKAKKKQMRKRIEMIQKYCSTAGFYTCLFVYVVARLCITVEVFRSLGFLLPETYVTTWATNVPHIN